MWHSGLYFEICFWLWMIMKTNTYCINFQFILTFVFEVYKDRCFTAGCLSRRRHEDSLWSFREKSMLVTIIILAGISVLIMAIYFKFNIRKYERWNYFIHYIEGNVNDRNEISILWNRSIKHGWKNLCHAKSISFIDCAMEILQKTMFKQMF